jgi:hypothetical protein
MLTMDKKLNDKYTSFGLMYLAVNLSDKLTIKEKIKFIELL